MSPGPTPPRRRRRLAPWLALAPLALMVLVGYLGTALWTLRMSLSSSRTFPAHDFVGLAQYERLFASERWRLSLDNLALYGALFVLGALVLGVLLAVAVDRRVRAEGVLRTLFLYPYAMSFVATGLVWQWLLNPDGGLGLDWIVREDRVVWAVALAGVWQAAGLVLALVLAGLRGVDDELWKATRVDGLPTWRVYTQIVLPMLAPTLATAALLLTTAAVKVYDTVVAMTQGGPGGASEVPAKFIMEHLFGRANLGLASAGAMVLLAGVVALAAPLLYTRSRAARGGGG